MPRNGTIPERVQPFTVAPFSLELRNVIKLTNFAIQSDIDQRQIEIEGQRRRFDAEKRDLTERISLNEKVRELNQFIMSTDGNVDCHTYGGASAEKGDPICTIAYPSATQTIE